MIIDLNSDLGEGFGPWPMGDDEALLGMVSSANVACGFHAGDPSIMRRVCALAVAGGVAVGAHVGYRDLAGFGRRAIDVDPGTLADEVLYQLGALDAFARAAGDRVRYVKPHGALYNTAVRDEKQAGAIVAAIRSYNPGLPVMCLPGSRLLELAEEAGIPAVAEAFADRAYTSEGTLVPRREPGSVLHDVDAIVERCVRMAAGEEIPAIDGSPLKVSARSICVHGDTPGAVAIATKVRAGLDAAGVSVAPFGVD
ncbi:LamB/YcsF family protein [Allokutzneria sp. A3M-2-11 16]|uniref:LamB/YcsF family protein n=1 Tax=Allokutzneria sp. A3M-2-11 16 TaxID=2962043 RepID=UPI0020B718B8|nr:5-oxoprolinase subunit PxpA [Allokutzneria sp. A3M-2-11 16]MCP3802691.1 LamB/YcsF family protein [Allokutzneria sp. A3M-2-11 16]